jgi:hypothetical protein
MDALKELQSWYYSYCDGIWEHQKGIKIGTIDNPGWRVEINSIGTKNENIPFESIKIERTEDDWVHCWIKDKVFNMACGPLNLEEALGIFLKWAIKGDGPKNLKGAEE